MKFRISLLLFISILFSCSKNEIESYDYYTEQSECTIIAGFISDSKTTIKDAYGNIVWNKGDSIALFGEKNTDALRFVTEDSATVTAVFRGPQPEKSSMYYSLYPFRGNSVYSVNNATITSLIPTEQRAIPGTYDPLSFICLAQSASLDKFYFENLCGGIRLTVGDTKYKKIVFKNNSNNSISGNAVVHLSDGVHNGNIECLSGGSNSIALVSGSHFEADKYYFITMAPQCLAKGFSLEFYDENLKLVKTTKCEVPIDIRPSVYSTVRNADAQSSLSSILGGTNLSESGTSNCYIVSEPGYYKFLVRQGNSDTKFDDVRFASVIWETCLNNKDVKAGTLVENVSLSGDYIYFKVPSDTKGKLTDGNAVIAARGGTSGKIFWSWHIWLCNGYQPDKSAEMMDRNLGSLGSGSSYPGLLYQWGRKDPFVGAFSVTSDKLAVSTSKPTTRVINTVTGTLSSASSSPTCYLMPAASTDGDWLYSYDNSPWGATKTIYDPCPPGWKVPSSEILQNIKSDSYPKSGYFTTDYKHTGAGSVACLWSYDTSGSSSSNRSVKALVIDSNKASVQTLTSSRARGHEIRCMREK